MLLALNIGLAPPGRQLGLSRRSMARLRFSSRCRCLGLTRNASLRCECCTNVRTRYTRKSQAFRVFLFNPSPKIRSAYAWIGTKGEPMDETEILKRITVNPKIFGGKPII